MAIDDKIRDKKLQYDIHRESTKISSLASSKIDKHKYFRGEEILPPEPSRMMGKAKFICSHLGKTFEK